jgi:hypothetical protein
MTYKKFDSSKHSLESGQNVKVSYWGKSRTGTVKQVKWPTRVLVEVPYTKKEQKELGGHGENVWFDTGEIKV